MHNKIFLCLFFYNLWPSFVEMTGTRWRSGERRLSESFCGECASSPCVCIVLLRFSDFLPQVKNMLMSWLGNSKLFAGVWVGMVLSFAAYPWAILLNFIQSTTEICRFSVDCVRSGGFEVGYRCGFKQKRIAKDKSTKNHFARHCRRKNKNPHQIWTGGTDKKNKNNEPTRIKGDTGLI